MPSPEYMKEYDRKRAHKRIAQDRKSHLKSMGLTEKQYDEMLASQNGKCAICGTSDPGWGHKNFVVDHDHGCCSETMQCGNCARGLLCMTCNIGLGQYEKYKDRAERYLDQVKTRAIYGRPLRSTTRISYGGHSDEV